MSDATDASRSSVGNGGTAPSTAQRLPKPVKIVLWSLCALFAYALPLLDPPIISHPGHRLRRRAVHRAVYVLVALGLNIVVGYAGLLDLGYVGFYAVGAYTVGVLTVGALATGRSCWRCRSRSRSPWSPA